MLGVWVGIMRLFVITDGLIKLFLYLYATKCSIFGNWVHITLMKECFDLLVRISDMASEIYRNRKSEYLSKDGTREILMSSDW